MAPTPNPDDWKNLPTPALRQIWQQRMGSKPCPLVKCLLQHELAWHAQRPSGVGLDAETRALLRAAIRQAVATHAEDDGSPNVGAAARRLSPRRTVSLSTGGRLVRTWNGVTHEVTIHDHGKRFEYQGKTYRSLTQIAKEITGAHWSGPRFFGLNRLRARK